MIRTLIICLFLVSPAAAQSVDWAGPYSEKRLRFGTATVSDQTTGESLSINGYGLSNRLGHRLQFSRHCYGGGSLSLSQGRFNDTEHRAMATLRYEANTHVGAAAQVGCRIPTLERLYVFAEVGLVLGDLALRRSSPAGSDVASGWVPGRELVFGVNYQLDQARSYPYRRNYLGLWVGWLDFSVDNLRAKEETTIALIWGRLR